MTDLEQSTKIVLDHLRDRGFPVATRHLDVESSPLDEGVVTTVRIADRSKGWTQDYADSLKAALMDLPGSPYVRLSRVRDFVEVLWKGEV